MEIIVKSNHRFKKFEITEDGIFVTFNDEKVSADCFWPIPDEKKERCPILKNWSYLLRNPMSKYHGNIVLQTRDDFHEYKIGYIYRNE